MRTIKAEEITRRLPLARHVIVEGAAHSAGNPGIASELVRATDGFAEREGGSWVSPSGS